MKTNLYKVQGGHQQRFLANDGLVTKLGQKVGLTASDDMAVCIYQCLTSTYDRDTERFYFIDRCMEHGEYIASFITKDSPICMDIVDMYETQLWVGGSA